MTSVHDFASTSGSLSAFIVSLPSSGDTAWIETSADDASLAATSESQPPRGVLTRLGACLIRPFRALQKWIARLLAGPASRPEAAGHPVRQAEPPMAAGKIAPPCFYARPGPEDGRYAAFIERAVAALVADATATAPGEGAHARSVASAEAVPAKQKRLRLKNFTRLIPSVQARAAAPLSAASQPGLAGARSNRINDLYFNLFTAPTSGRADPALLHQAPSAYTRQVLGEHLSAARTQGRCYRALALDTALKQLVSGQHFVARDDALAVFLGGVVDLADKLLKKHQVSSAPDLQDRDIEVGVEAVLSRLTSNERIGIKLRLGDFLAEKAERIGTFAHEQASRHPGGNLGHQLALLGLGSRVLEALLDRLDLDPLVARAAVPVADVTALAVDELAALSRLLMPPEVLMPRV